MYDELDFINNEDIDENQILILTYDIKIDISCSNIEIDKKTLFEMQMKGKCLKEELQDQILITESQESIKGKDQFYSVSIFCHKHQILDTIDKIHAVGLILSSVHDNRTGMSYYIPNYSNYNHFL